MKAVLLLAVLSVLGVSQSADVKVPLQAPESQAPDFQAPDSQAPDSQAPDSQAPDSQALRYNLNLGHVGSGDRLLRRAYLYQPPVANAIKYQDFVYRCRQNTRITAIQVNEVSYSQYAVPSLLSGGLGYNSVTIRVQSARGYGFYYLIDIWGR